MQQSRSSATFISWDSFPGISHQYLCDNQDQAQPLPLGIVFRAFRNVDDLVCTCQFASLLDEFVILFTPFFSLYRLVYLLCMCLELRTST